MKHQLLAKQDGLWLSIDTDDGKHALIRLDEHSPGIVGAVVKSAWAYLREHTCPVCSTRHETLAETAACYEIDRVQAADLRSQFDDDMAKPAPDVDWVVDEPQPTPLGVQIGGDHYKCMPIQPVQYIHANGIPYLEGNVIKYVSRWRAKGGMADLEKARHYIDLLIQLESEHENYYTEIGADRPFPASE